MAIALVGTIGTAVQSASGSALSTLAFGTGENRTTGNLLVLFVGVTGTATLPTTPANWNIGKQLAGTSCSATVYWKAATGGDAAPTINAITSGVIAGQLAEFSGANVAAIDQSGSAAATSSPVTATFAGADAATSELLVATGADFRSASRTPSDTWTSNHVTSVTQAGNNNGTSSANHYSFGYGLTNSISGADTAVLTLSVTTSLTGAVVAAATFKVGVPQTPAPTALAMTFTGATPTVTVTNNVSVAPAAMALTFAGAAPVLGTGLAPTSFAMTWTGATPSVLLGTKVLPSGLSMTWAGATPTISTPVSVAPTAMSLTWSGATPSVQTPIATAPSAMTLAWTGSIPTVSTPILTQPSALALAWTGSVPTVTVGTGSPIQVSPTALALAWTGSIPTVAVGGRVGAHGVRRVFIPYAPEPVRRDDSAAFAALSAAQEAAQRALRADDEEALALLEDL